MSVWGNLAAGFEDGDILYGLGRGAAKAAILEYRRQITRCVRVCFFRTTKHFDRIIIQNDLTNATFPLATGGQVRTNRS